MTLPNDVVLVTVGVDVQARYVASLTMGWTEQQEAWALEWEFFDGDVRDPAVLRTVVETAHALRYEHPSGSDVPIHLLGIDRQFQTDDVLVAVNYANRLRGHLWCYGTTGIGGRGATGDGLIVHAHDVRDRDRHRGQRPLLINTDVAKDEIAAMLSTSTPGPMYLHVPKRLGRAFLEQVTAEERRDKIDSDGAVVGYEWKRKGDRRNEGLDCACINLALFRKVTKAQWWRLLTDRHGAAVGLERWQAKYPGERIAAVPRSETPRPSGWLADRHPKGGWRTWAGY